MDIFTAAERSEIVYDILLKTKYGIEDQQVNKANLTLLYLFYCYFIQFYLTNKLVATLAL
jgi:hypothetical protein